MSESFIERKIVIGLITSTEFVKQIRRIYKSRFLISSMAKRISSWCIEYYDDYDSAPGKVIESIFMEKLKGGLNKDLAEEIEEDIFPELSKEYENSKTDIRYLVKITQKYFHLGKYRIWENINRCFFND